MISKDQQKRAPEPTSLHGEGLMPPPDPELAELTAPKLVRTEPNTPPATTTQAKTDPEAIEKLSIGTMLRSSAEIIKIAFQGSKGLAWTRGLLAIPTAAAGCAIGLLTGELIDSVSKTPQAAIQDPKTALWALLAGSVVFGLAKTGELIAQHRFNSNKVQTIDAHMRDGLRSQLPSTLISKEFQTKLATVRGENWRIYEFCGKPMEAWTNTLQIMVSLATVGFVGRSAILPLAVAGVAQALAAWWERRDYDRMFNKLKDKYQVSNNVWYQFLIPSALKEMVLTRKDEKIAEVGKKVSDEIREVQSRVHTRSAIRQLGAEVVGYGALGVALYNCVRQVQAGQMSAGELSAVIVAASQFRGATTGLIDNTFGQLKGISIVQKFIELCRPVKAKERTSERANEIEENLVNSKEVPEITFSKVSFSYPVKAKEENDADTLTAEEASNPFLLKEVSFTLPQGQIIGLAGKNGAGKSTIINLLLGLYKPSGTISANGIDLNDLNSRTEWLPRIGVLLQDHTLFTGLNIHEQIVSASTQGFTPDKPHFSVAQVAEASDVENEIAKIAGGYKAIIGDNLNKGVKLSGGQQQKVALARALESRPDILILDEPTASLDATAAKDLLPKLRRFCDENDYHPTILVVTHKMDLFPQCDHVLVMHEGELKGEGTHQELMEDTTSVYHKLYKDYRNEPKTTAAKVSDEK